MKTHFLDFFKIGIICRTIHTGMGYDTGDGMDITDKVVYFGRANWNWANLIIGIRIKTNENIYFFNLFRYKWVSKDFHPSLYEKEKDEIFFR